MPKKQEKPWQYKFSFALSLVMLALVLGYFVQSFLEIRRVQPVRVAIERIGETAHEAGIDPESEALRRKGSQEDGDDEAAKEKSD
ncbi:MAG: hypothetical protein U9Q81_22720 [Pseudomonadota bacterium]|nr:hypothetical protein [Pseudomonadota bacterium]